MYIFHDTFRNGSVLGHTFPSRKLATYHVGCERHSYLQLTEMEKNYLLTQTKTLATHKKAAVITTIK